MAALKLFISHSSRLDDVEPACVDAASNWNLLKATRDALQDHYKDRIEILVDLNLQAADHWELRLHEWLAECHVAIILFSKRALHTSNWVKKESTILAWRRHFKDGFKLIPVTLKDQTCAEDLAEDYFGTLGIIDSQCVRDAACAGDILAGVIEAIGEPEALIRHGTPFDRLISAVADVIAKDTKSKTLEDLWEKVADTPVPLVGHLDRLERYAQALARLLLRDGQQALRRLHDFLDGISPWPLDERAEELLRRVRSLWVDARAAGLIPAARDHGDFLALSGELVTWPEPILGTKCFTLERYLERAWPGTGKIKIITVTKVTDPDTVRDEIRRGFRSEKSPWPAHRTDNAINNSNCHIFVLVYAPECDFDPDQLDVLRSLRSHYPRLLYVFATGPELPVHLPDGVRPIYPAVEPDTEWAQLAMEIEARELIDGRY